MYIFKQQWLLSHCHFKYKTIIIMDKHYDYVVFFFLPSINVYKQIKSKYKKQTKTPNRL